MDKLTREQVMHVAHLARIEVTEEEIEKYQVQLKQLLDDVEKIREIDCSEETLLVTPVEYHSTLREDKNDGMIAFEDVKKNVPSVTGNFVEVPVMINE